MITALAGGVGASKFLEGLAQVLPPEEISVVVNTGDDLEMFGLYIAPDLDIVTYTLAEAVNRETGWGLSGDTFNVGVNVTGTSGALMWAVDNTQIVAAGNQLQFGAGTITYALY